METQLLTRKQTAAIFGIQPRTIIKWEKRKVLLPALYVQGRPRYAMSDIEKVVTSKQTTYNSKRVINGE